jgi:hypothetical protein
MYYIGLDVHRKTISYCVKAAAGHVHQEGKVGSTRCELDAWVRTLPQPRMIAMEATTSSGDLAFAAGAALVRTSAEPMPPPSRCSCGDALGRIIALPSSGLEPSRGESRSLILSNSFGLR